MDRLATLSAISSKPGPFDIAVIGGGATGASIALDAATRGLNTVLFEQADFGQGTSSRSTKLVHGGVRYLAQGDIRLVRDALRERGRLRRNAPHVVHARAFALPCQNRWEKWWYRAGFWCYDLLAGASSFPRARSLTAATCMATLPTVMPQRARGGVLYSDGQFDDSRLLINLLQSAADHGAFVINYAAVHTLKKNDRGAVVGLGVTDTETGHGFEVEARCVINATGPFCDAVRQLDSPTATPLVTPAQGIHLVFRKDFFPGDTAMIIPRTPDGRVLFAIPWHDHVVVGTTDTPIPRVTLEPTPLESEVRFLLDTLGQYLSPAPQAEDILSVFTGIRPLVSKQGHAKKTSALSRDHTILTSPSGLITITGGKWTTARKMAEDCVDQAIAATGLPAAPCQTQTLPIHGAPQQSVAVGPLALYGTDATAIAAIQQSTTNGAVPLVPGHTLTPGEVLWHVRSEMARTVEDVLARRHRMLFLDAAAAEAAAPHVARLIAAELGYDAAWEESQLQAFTAVVSQFRWNAAASRT